MKAFKMAEGIEKFMKQKMWQNQQTKIKRMFKPTFIAKKYRSMTIYKKLSISFLAVAVISSVLISAVGVINLKNNNNMSQSIYSEDLVPLSPLYRIETDFLSMEFKVNSDDFFTNQAAISNYVTQLDAELSKYSKSVTDTNEKADLSQMVSDITDFQNQGNNALNYFSLGLV
jgi:methyl-accepting chemotaxis protein